MLPSPDSSYTPPRLRPAVIRLRTKSVTLRGSDESYSEEKASSMQDLSLQPRSPYASRNLPDKFSFPFTNPASKTVRDTPTTPSRSTSRLAFPLNMSNNLQERDPELDPIMPRNPPATQSYSKQPAIQKLVESHVENPINRSFRQKVIDLDELESDTGQNNPPQFINPFNGQKFLNDPVSHRSNSPPTRRALGKAAETFSVSSTRRQTFTSIVSVPKKIARTFSANVLRRQGSNERNPVGERIGGDAVNPVANFGSQERIVDTVKSLEALKCATPSLRSATNTQSSAASSPELGSDILFPEENSDRNGSLSRMNGHDPLQSHSLRYETIREIEVDLESPPIFQRRMTFSNAARAPMSLAKKFSRTFSTTSRHDLTELILETDRANESAKTANVPSVTQEFRDVDFTSKTGLSSQPKQPKDRLDGTLSLSPSSKVAKNTGKASSIRGPQYHKPTLFSQRYDGCPSPAESERPPSSPCGGNVGFDDLIFPCPPQPAAEDPPFPPTASISTLSQSHLVVNPSHKPLLESLKPVDHKIQFSYQPQEKPVDFLLEFHPTSKAQAGMSHIRPRTAPLLIPPQRVTRTPTSPSPETPTSLRTADRGPGIEMAASLLALEELCNGSWAFFGDDESVFDAEGTIDPLHGDSKESEVPPHSTVLQ